MSASNGYKQHGWKLKRKKKRHKCICGGGDIVQTLSPPMSLPVLSIWTNTSALRWHNLTLPPSVALLRTPFVLTRIQWRGGGARGEPQRGEEFGEAKQHKRAADENPIHKKSFDSVRKSAFWTHGKLSHTAFIGRICFKCLRTSSHLFENLFRTKVIMAKVNTHTERERERESERERGIKELTAWKISIFHQSSYACKLHSFQLYSLRQ